MEFIKYQMDFLNQFVNKKLIIESNKFKDTKIQNQLNNNLNDLSNDLFDNQIKDLKNISEDSEEYLQKKVDIKTLIKENVNKAIESKQTALQAKLQLQINAINQENLELKSRINYTLENGATPENNFEYEN